MLNLALQFFFSNLILLLSLKFVPGLEIEETWKLIPTFFIVGFFNFLLRPIYLLLRPDGNVIGLGLFCFIMNFLILNTANGIIDEFALTSWTGALFGAVILAFIQAFLDGYDDVRGNAIG